MISRNPASGKQDDTFLAEPGLVGDLRELLAIDLEGIPRRAAASGSEVAVITVSGVRLRYHRLGSKR